MPWCHDRKVHRHQLTLAGFLCGWSYEICRTGLADFCREQSPVWDHRNEEWEWKGGLGAPEALFSKWSTRPMTVVLPGSSLSLPYRLYGRLELPSLHFWQWVSTFCGPSKHNLDQRDDGAQHFWNFPKLQWHLRVFSKTLATSNRRAGEGGWKWWRQLNIEKVLIAPFLREG